jgi:replicative superfamily II helicase
MSKNTLKYANSAGRLLAIIEGLKANLTIVDQLVPVMLDKTPSKDNKIIVIDGLKVSIELQKMYLDFLRDLENADISEEERAVLKKGLSSLDSLIFLQGVNQSMRVATESEKALLEVCATRLPKENIINEDDLNNIKESVTILRDAINELPHGSVLRQMLLELARLSEDAINRFHIYGAKGLKSAFKDMLAEVSEIYLQEEEDVEEIKESTAWKSIVDHLKLFDSIAAKTMKYRPLLEKASQYLIGG